MIRALKLNDLHTLEQRIHASMDYYPEDMGTAGTMERARLSGNAVGIISKCLPRPDFRCLGAFDGRDLSGFIIVRHWSDNCNELFWLVSFKGYQGQSQARRLIDHCRLLSSKAFLTVHPNNTRATSLYRSAGFRATGRMTRRHLHPREFYVFSPTSRAAS